MASLSEQVNNGPVIVSLLKVRQLQADQLGEWGDSPDLRDFPILNATQINPSDQAVPNAPNAPPQRSLSPVPET